MFTTTELRERANQLLAAPLDSRWSANVASLDMTYFQAAGEENVNIFSGPLVLAQGGSDVPLDPISFWLHSSMWISYSRRGMRRDGAFWTMLNTKEEQDRLINFWANKALCRAMPVADFYERYKTLTQGRLPRALEKYKPMTQAMTMEDDWNSRIFLAKNAAGYVTLSWHTSG